MVSCSLLSGLLVKFCDSCRAGVSRFLKQYVGERIENPFISTSLVTFFLHTLLFFAVIMT
jgi:hypothetical protein